MQERPGSGDGNLDTPAVRAPEKLV
jgi:hypothetical protein